MMKKLAIATATATLGLAAFSGAANAAPPADGTCVAKGVQSLTGAQKAGAAKLGLMSTVIKDHVFDANSLGITTADCS